jgi:dihydroxy-acid dehydratase
VGGPLGLVRNGDQIRLDVDGRSINLLVDESELDGRRAAQSKVHAVLPERGYARLFQQTVTQADKGCDFDFMIAKKT